jgi:hypothetical protein
LVCVRYLAVAFSSLRFLTAVARWLLAFSSLRFGCWFASLWLLVRFALAVG